MTIRVVSFDFAETLALKSPQDSEILRRFLESNGIHRTADIIRDKILATRATHPYSSLQTALLSREEYLESYNVTLLANLEVGLSPQGLFEFFTSFSRQWRLAPHVGSTLKRLKSSGLQVGVSSNFDLTLRQRLDELGILEDLDFVLVSSELGIEKPNLNFFGALRDSFPGLKPEQLIHIGDSMELDFLPAIRSGLRAMLICSDLCQHPLRSPLHAKDLTEAGALLSSGLNT